MLPPFFPIISHAYPTTMKRGKVIPSSKNFKVFKVVLIEMVVILMMLLKLAILDLLKIKAFQNNVYVVIIFVHDVSSKLLSCNSNNIVNMDM